MTEPKRIAIIGSGVSGIAALYSLRDSGHQVHLYESSNRLGGHTNTVDWNHNGKTTKVDTGFIVINSFTYPNFIAFLKELNIPTVDTEMSFSVTQNQGEFEWSGTNPFTLFAQKENLWNPTFYRMLFDVFRFNAFALDLLNDPNSDTNDMSIGTYLDLHRYSETFKNDYLLPMTACIWSTGPEKCGLDFPAVTLVRFMWNHYLLTVTQRPTWMTVPGGTNQYIQSVIQKHLPKSRLHLNTTIASIKQINAHGQTQYTLQSSGGKDLSPTFDEVIFACHGDQSFNILANNATELEKEILGKFSTSPNIAYLHNDINLLPKRENAWAAWNYLKSSKSKSSKSAVSVALTYNMNILQHIPTKEFSHVLVTLNPPIIPSTELTQAIYPYRHPVYTPQAVKAQKRLHEINGKRGLHFIGAWTGYGFHEDGFTSGIRAGISLGGSVPWNVQDAKEIRGKKAQMSLFWECSRLIIIFILFIISVWDSFTASLSYVNQSRIARLEKQTTSQQSLDSSRSLSKGRKRL